MRSADASDSSSKRAFAQSTAVTVDPTALSHAAADAMPNGWRPISNVLTRRLRISLKHCILPTSMTVSSSVPVVAPAQHDRAFFGHPRGLSTLFFTEMWERFSYYGMRALLILFMTAAPAAGGLGFDTGTAGAVYGLYTSMVYMTSLPGG